MLYARLTQDGAIAEPRGKPLPQFALPSAIDWMRALRLLSADVGLDFAAARRFYAAAGVGPRPMPPQQENTALEQLFLALHHLSALKALAATGQAGNFHEPHAAVHREWDAEIA